MLKKLKEAYLSHDIVPLVYLVIIGSVSLVLFIYFIYGQYFNKLNSVVTQVELESQKMRLNSELMELARARTRLTSQIIDTEDPFEQDEINLQLETYAGKFAGLRSQLLKLDLTDEETNLLNYQSEIVPIILPKQRQAVTLAMSGGKQQLKKAQQILYETVLPGQGNLIDSFAKLIAIEQNKIAELSINSHESIQNLKQKSLLFIVIALIGIILLSTVVVKRIKKTQQELFDYQVNLENIVKERTDELTVTNNILEKTVDDMVRTQNRLVETERMVSLGQLVAGVAHEVNTPLGIGITAASHLDYEIKDIQKDYANKKITQSQLEKFFEASSKGASLIIYNLQRAAELISSFKQVSVDQTSEQTRKFDLKEYINEVVISIQPQFKNTGHTITINCPDKLEINNIPGVFSQIITNLVMNSLLHAFNDKKDGHINIDIANKKSETITITYKDDGKGMTQEQRKKIFEPFYTTSRSRGGTGLGMFVVYNLVTQKIGGDIACESSPGQGITISISFPVDYQKES